jgi:hypothetical protein
MTIPNYRTRSESPLVIYPVASQSGVGKNPRGKMSKNRQRILIIITHLVLLSFACSYLPLSSNDQTPDSTPTNIALEAIPVTPAASLPTLTIPVFEPTVTHAATDAITLGEVATGAAPTKKVKTPSTNQTADPNQVCPNAQPTRLRLNGFAFLTYDPPIPNRARIGPGLGFDAKGLVKPGQVMQLTSGPICSGESVWWKVDVKYSGLTGWVAEADSEQYYLEPCPAEGHCPPLTP